MPASVLFLQGSFEGEPIGIAWLGILIAVAFIGAVIYLLKRSGPGGPSSPS